MHFCLYLCLPRSQAKTSLRARKLAVDYLSEEQFASEARFAGRCDYFSVGGNWSGRLELLRIRATEPAKFRQFWKRLDEVTSVSQAKKLFKKSYPQYKKPVPVARNVPYEGADDDAQILDAVLLKQLKKGIRNDVDYSWEPEKPNVLFTDLGEDDWMDVEIIGNYWVVVIDYHA